MFRFSKNTNAYAYAKVYALFFVCLLINIGVIGVVLLFLLLNWNIFNNLI